MRNMHPHVTHMPTYNIYNLLNGLCSISESLNINHYTDISSQKRFNYSKTTWWYICRLNKNV